MSVTLQDVAQAAGVSAATVSRVLSGHKAKLFVPSTRQRIHEAAKRLGYRPSLAARALATGRTALVTLWSYHPYQPFYAMVMESVQKQAREHGYGLLVADVAAGGPGDVGPNAAVWPSDGILAVDCGEYSERVFQASPNANTPVVSMGTVVIPETDVVQLDLSNAFRQATEHLVAEGCRRIAYFSYLPKNENGVLARCYRAPRNAYRTAIHDAGLEEEYIWMNSDTRAASRRTLVDYVRKHGWPDGILCRDDETAIGAYRAICDLGKRVGRDVLLIGCDGIQDTQYLECPLSTVAAPVERMCELAWEFLANRMANPSAPRQHALVEAALVLRESSQRSTKRARKKRRSPEA
jgi:LacI family transcriptional regulator